MRPSLAASSSENYNPRSIKKFHGLRMIANVGNATALFVEAFEGKDATCMRSAARPGEASTLLAATSSRSGEQAAEIRHLAKVLWRGRHSNNRARKNSNGSFLILPSWPERAVSNSSR
jgi:hypothetical protein